MEEWIDEKERKFDIKQCILYIFDHIALMLIAAVLLGGALFGYSYYKAKKDNNSESKSQNEILDDIVFQNHEAAFPDPANKTKYRDTEKSRLEGTCVVRATVFLDYNLEDVNNPNVNIASLIDRYQRDAFTTLVSIESLESIANEVNSKSYSDLDENHRDLTNEDIRWMVSASSSGVNYMFYSVTDVSIERAKDIVSLMYERFSEKLKGSVEFKTYKLDGGPSVYYDLTDAESEEQSVSMGPIVKKSVIGAVAGVLLVCAVYLIIFVLVDKVRTVSDAEYLELETLGKIPHKNKNRERELKRFAYNISLKNGNKKIALMPVDDVTDADEIFETVESELSKTDGGVKLSKVDCYISAPDSILKLKESDAVVLLATFGTTSMKNLEYCKNELLKHDIDVLGVVLTQCRH